jgi:flagellar motor switch protein FliG
MKTDMMQNAFAWKLKASFIAGLAAGLMSYVYPVASYAKVSVASAVEFTERTAEGQVRNLLEPLLEKYCQDECKLMSVNATIDIATPDEVAPGFNDIDPKSATKLAPSSAHVKLLIDEKVGPISRTKLIDLIQQYLDTLDFPVKVETQTVRFPQPVGSAGKVTELRERITKQFRSTLEDLFRQFCPNQCLLADYELQTEVVNTEEAQYGPSGEFAEDNGTAIRIKNITSTILVDETLSPEERTNIVEMAKLKTNFYKNVTLGSKTLKFPRPTTFQDDLFTVDGRLGATGLRRGPASGTKATESTTTDLKATNTSSNIANTTHSNTNEAKSNESTSKQERFERIEKIERVENGDAVQAELHKFKIFGLIFACSVLFLLIMLAIANFRPKVASAIPMVQRVIQTLTADPVSVDAPSTYRPGAETSAQQPENRKSTITKRYEIERLLEELLMIFSEHPKVAKHVFTRVLTEEGVETTAHYLHLFGESVVIDMLRDPSLQSDLNELIEFYAKNQVEIDDDDKLDLLRKLHNRTVAGKLFVMGSRSSHLFDFLAEMDGTQILELIRNESLTVKSIILTQCDPQKRSSIYSQMDEETRMKLMGELSRIDYLPRDYIFNVANALKRKRRDNPKLNTEALPGSEVLLSLLERTNLLVQRAVIKNLELSNPESARTLKSKMVSIDTLRYLRDGQLLEVVLSLRHDELLQFLRGASDVVRNAIFSKSPKDLVLELEDELAQVSLPNREIYQALERKVINRMKLMANDSLINLIETNERMLADAAAAAASNAFVEAGPPGPPDQPSPPSEQTKILQKSGIKKVAGW